MRKLLWFTVGFSASMAVCAYLLSSIWMLVLAFGCIISLCVLLCIRKNIRPVILTLLIGFIFGSTYYFCFHHFFLSDAKDYDAVTIPVEVKATDFSFQTDYGMGVDGIVYLNGRSYRTRLYYQGNDSFSPGDRIYVSAKLRYTPYGGLEISTYHKGEGIFLLSYGQDLPVVDRTQEYHWRYLCAYLRKGISDRINEVFPDDTAAFANALLIGDDSKISFRDNISFQKSGIRHVIAVSGLHVSILFSIIYHLARKKIILASLIGFPILFLFAAVAGFSPSIVRACIMQAMLIISLIINREYDPGTALSFACVVILSINPLAITSISFQLSVGCMIGIILFSSRISDYLKGVLHCGSSKSRKGRALRWLIGSVSISVSAMIFTMPLCAAYFGMISVVGVLTNLLVLWVISFIFCGIIAACIVSILWMPLGYVVAWGVSWLIRYVLAISNLLADVPGGVIYAQSIYAILWVVFTITIIIASLISRRKAPKFLTFAVTGIYFLSLVASWAEPRIGNVQVTVMDVGQGQCILLQCKNEAYLIDCGGSDAEQTASIAINTLGAQGVYQLDGIILTHYDEDHCNGAAYVMQSIPVKQLYLPDTDEQNEVRNVLENGEVPICWVSQNILLPVKSGCMEIIPGISSESDNESSLCILFRGEKCDILITGDRSVSGEHILLEQNDIPELELLVAGHHGASASTGFELLKKCTPAVVAISVGSDNSHGHPNDDTLKRLQAAGCIIRRTDLEGTIIFRG